MRRSRVVALFAVAGAMLTAAADAQENKRIDLAAGWTLQSAAKIKSAKIKKADRTGDGISRPGYAAAGWHQATVPTTPVAALVKDGTFPDPYFGKNMRELPGVKYGIGENFSLKPMPADSPFAVPWWYRTEFAVPADFANRQVMLHLDGVSFRANVWLNGKQIANSKDIAGTWRLFELDVTSGLAPGKTNALAIQV